MNAVDPDTQELYNKEASKMFGVDKPLPKRFINSFTSDFIKFGQSALSEEVRTNIYEDEQNRIGERNTLFNKASRYAYFVTWEEKRGNQQKAKQFENEYYEFLSNIKDDDLSQSVHRHYIKEASIKESDLIKNFIRPIINISQPETRAMVYHHEISRDSFYTIDDIVEMKSYYKNYPEMPLIILQSNNYFDIDDHVNCVNHEDELADKNDLFTLYYKGKTSLPLYDRYMVIGRWSN